MMMRRMGNSASRWAAFLEKMGWMKAMYTSRSLAFDNTDGLGNGAACIDLIVHHDNIAIHHITDQRESLGIGIISSPALFNERDRQVEVEGIVAPLLGESQVGGHNDRLMHLCQQIIPDMLTDHVGGGQHIARDREETLDLPGMRVRVI